MRCRGYGTYLESRSVFTRLLPLSAIAAHCCRPTARPTYRCHISLSPLPRPFVKQLLRPGKHSATHRLRSRCGGRRPQEVAPHQGNVIEGILNDQKASPEGEADTTTRSGRAWNEQGPHAYNGAGYGRVHDHSRGGAAGGPECAFPFTDLQCIGNRKSGCISRTRMMRWAWSCVRILRNGMTNSRTENVRACG